MRKLRQHAMSMSDLARHSSNKVLVESYDEIGYNYRMSNVLAGIGRAQLRALPERIAARRAEVAAELARAEALLSGAEAAKDAGQLAAVEAEAPPPVPGRKSPLSPRLPYRKFSSQSGAPILVGRSARDNDALTLRVARGNDLWLHARGVQGAHVIVPGAGDSPDSRALGDAALLAAHCSSARGQDGVEVAWTRCKYVRKPKGAPPGSVTVTQEKVLRVRLEEDRLQSLLRTEG